MTGMVAGKVAVVTGAGRGIGRGVALLMASEGARVVVCDIGASLEGAGSDPSAAQQVVDELKPDIQVDVHPDDERAYFVDAYKALPRAGTSGATNVASLSVTNKPRRRINEAELVRMLRDGETPEDETNRTARPSEPARPMITDPALARAIDLLKALAVVRPARS